MKNTEIKKYYREIKESRNQLDDAVRRGDKKAAADYRKELKLSHDQLKEARRSAGKARRNAKAGRDFALELMVAY